MATMTSKKTGAEKQEEKTAGVLYMYITFAVFISIILFFVIGNKRIFNLQDSVEETVTTPQKPPDVPE